MAAGRVFAKVRSDYPYLKNRQKPVPTTTWTKKPREDERRINELQYLNTWENAENLLHVSKSYS